PVNSAQYNDYLLIIVVVCTIIVLRAYYDKPKMFSQLLRAAFNFSETAKILLDNNVIQQRISFFMNLVFLVNTSILCFLSIRIFNISLPAEYNMVLLAIIFGIITIYYLIRTIIYALVGYITDCVNIQKQYIKIWMSLNKWYGLILLPVIITLLYLPGNIRPYMVYIIASLYAIFFIIKILRGIKLSINNRLSFLVIFLYLCTLELLPVIVLLKYISGVI
ncbi:MAG: DUF4271 domain-containing protein, partial [Bacteroidota bacterium]